MRTEKLPIVITLLLVMAALTFATEASAKQCVFNKGGYVLRVSWYHRGNVATSDFQGGPRRNLTRNIGPPAKTEALTAGFGSCNDSDEVMVAFLSIPGCMGVPFPDGTRRRCGAPTLITAGTMMKVFSQTAIENTGDMQMVAGLTPVTCTPDHPANSGYCEDVNAWELPRVSGQEVVLITEPSTSRYLDFWGGINDVAWGAGGPVPVSGCGWVNGADPALTTDPGRGVTDWNAHYQWLAGGGSVPTAAAFVGQRATSMSTCASRNDFAKLYAALSVTIGAVGRVHAGWVDGGDPNATTDNGRGISDRNAHYQWAAGGASLPTAAGFISQRMNALTGIPRDVYAKLYADVSVQIAKCGTERQCGP